MGPFLFLLAAQACITATPSCTEPVPVGDSGRWSLIYRSQPIQTRNESIRRAFILIHGQGRNADDYFRTAMAATFLAGALEDTIVISPRFASNDGTGCKDKLATGEISYSCGEMGGWRGGMPAASPSSVNSYDFMDAVLRQLARKELFPNLKEIVVAGHSAGGQYVSRYVAASKIIESLGVPVRFVPSNPSSYLYLDKDRPSSTIECSAAGGCKGDFVLFREGRNCTTYNQWLYGLEKRQGYAAAVSDEELNQHLVSRQITYLLSELDTLPIAGFDSSCPAMAQGPSRFIRGVDYWNYMTSRYKAPHKLVTVPLCGHNARCVFTSEPGLAVVFGTN